MDALEPYYCEPKHAPNPENDNSDDSEVDNHMEKIQFSGLGKDAKSVVDFSAQFWVGWNDVTYM